MGSKISCLIKNEKEQKTRKLIILERVAEKNRNRKSRDLNLSLLELECILFYFNTRKRLELSLFYPKFRILERQCPLTLDSLYISSGEIEIDGTIYEFGIPPNMRLVKRNQIVEYGHFGVFQFVQKLFVGRDRCRVRKLDLGFKIPFKLNIDCDRVYADLKNVFSHASYYSNVIGKIESLMIPSLRSPDDLNYPWIQDVNTMIVYSSQLSHFLPALPKIPAETIIVKFKRATEELYDLIRIWCESRNGKVGSQLFINFWNLRDIQKEFDFSRLFEMEVIEESNKRWRLPMDNNSEARLSIRKDYQSFCKRYSIGFSGYYKHLCLEVVNL